MSFEFGAISDPRPEGGDDRIFTQQKDEVEGVFAVFDGAGSSYASDMALDTLREIVESGSTTEVASMARQIQETLRWAQAGKYLTTGTIVQIGASVCRYASAGDSPLYCFSHSLQRLTRLNSNKGGRPNPISRRLSNWWRGEKLIEVGRNFFGSSRMVLEQGSVPFDPGDVLVLATDGVMGEEDQLLTRYLRGILSEDTLTALEIARTVLYDTKGRTIEVDDRAIVVVRALE